MSGFTVASGPGRPPELDAFTARAEGRSFATSPAFARAFARSGPGWPSYTILLRGPQASGPPLAALTGFLERRFGGTWLRAMPYGTPGGPLFAPELSPEDRRLAAAALWAEFDRVSRAEGWLGGDLAYSGPAVTDAALRAPADLGCERMDEAHVVDLSAGPEAWLAGLRKRARQQFTKSERYGVIVEQTVDPADVTAVHVHYLAQAAAWGIRAIRPLPFVLDLLAAPEPEGGARMWVARFRGEVVCGVLAFVHASSGESYAWFSGSGLEARRQLAFPYVLSRIMMESGSPRVNLGFSGHQSRLTNFKEQMGARPVPVPIVEFTPRPRTPYHALLVAARERLRARPAPEAA